MLGGANNDILIADVHDQEVHGGSGFDVAIFTNTEQTATTNQNIILDLYTSSLEAVYTGGGNDFIRAIDKTESVSIYAGAGTDTVAGGRSNDLIHGQAGNDTLIGNEGNDQLHGGQGRDLLRGGAGNDIYYWNLGDGDDRIDDYDATDAQNHQHIDTLVLGTGISADQLVWDASDNNSDLVLSIKVNNEIVQSLTVINWNDGSQHRLEKIVLADGSEVPLNWQSLGTDDNDLLNGSDYANNLNGLAGNDVIYGNGGDDHLDGGSGNDYLAGGTGNDTYYWHLDEGDDKISHYASSDESGAAHENILQLGAGISANNMEQAREANNLLLTVNKADGSYQTLTLLHWFISSHYQLDKILLHSEQGLQELDLNNVTWASGSSQNDDVLYGSDEANTLDALGGNDAVYGHGGNDQLYGGAGDDTLNGGAGDDDLYGQIGNDILHGGAGNDTYYWGLNQGNDRINDYNTADAENSEHIDTLILPTGIEQDALKFYRLVDDLVLTVETDGTSQSLTISDWFKGPAYQLSAIEFADGSSVNLATLPWSPLGTDGNDLLEDANASNTLRGLGGNDIIYGHGGDDHLYGNAGNDLLYGGSGNDTYYWGIGDGNDRINNFDNSVSHQNDIDTLVLDIDPTQHPLVWTRADNHLVLTVHLDDGSQQSLTLTRWFEDERFQLQHIELSNGQTIAIDTINWSTPGTHEDDVIHDSDHDNTLSGLAGNDTIYGKGGNDHLNGNEGNDYLTGGLGNDHLHGGTGNDRLFGGAGDDVYYWNLGDGNDYINDYNSDDDANPGHVDKLILGAGITLGTISWYSDGHDLIISVPISSEQDNNATQTLTLKNWLRDDAYQLQILLADSDTPVDMATIAWTPLSDDDTDFMFDNGAGNALYGQAGNDLIYGNGGNDQLYGGTGDDILVGGQGDDQLHGGEGNDTLVGDEGNNTYYWNLGDGDDEIYHFASSDDNDQPYASTLVIGNGIAVSDITWSSQGYHLIMHVNKDDTSQTLTLMNWLLGANYQLQSILVAGAEYDLTSIDWTPESTDGDDVLFDSNTAKTLRGGAGNDTIYSNGGDDQLFGDAGDDHLHGGVGNDLFFGGTGNDHLHGGTGDDYLSGGLGSDTYYWNLGDGNDLINNHSEDDNNGTDHVDTLVFGENIDADDIEWFGKNHDLVATITLEDGSSQSLKINGYLYHSVYRLDIFKFSNEQILDLNTLDWTPISTEYDDTLIDSDTAKALRGGAGNDTIYGNGGNDQLFGDTGDDHLYGGAGDDQLTGGEGSDTYHWGLGDGNDVIYHTNSTDTEGVQHTNQLVLGAGINFENLTYHNHEGDLIFTIVEDGDDNGDSDSLPRLTLKNWYQNEAHQLQNITFADGTEFDLSRLIPTITGTENNDTLQGTNVGDHINGLDGDDRLYGNAGDDHLWGGAGTDRLYGGAGNDTYYWNIGDGHNTAYDYESNGVDYIQDIDILMLGEEINIDSLELTSNGFDLTLKASPNDYFIIKNWWNNIDNNLHQAITYKGDKVDLTRLTWTPITSDRDNVIRGTINGDTYHGLAGNDTLFGNKGDDHLYGNEGNDYLQGDEGNDTYYWGLGDGNDTIQDWNDEDLQSNSNVDTLQLGLEIETKDLIWTKSNFNLILNIVNSSENYQSMTLQSWFAGTGYRIEQITLSDGTNIDLSNIQLSILGTQDSDHTLHGDDSNNHIYGLAGNDDIYGNAGDDHLYGGEGDDYLEGGTGDDTYYWGIGDGNDRINDYDNVDRYIDHQDTLVLGEGIHEDNLTWTSQGANLVATVTLADGSQQSLSISGWINSSPSQLERIQYANGEIIDITTLDWTPHGTNNNDYLYDSDQSHTIYGLAGNDAIEGYGGNDYLYGDEGDDAIYGGIGNDHLYGGKGDDRLYGGSGNDTLFFGEAGYDHLYGAAGNDLFVWVNSELADRDVINGFSLSDDLIDLRLLAEQGDDEISFDDLIIQQDGINTLLQVGNSIVELRNINAADLTEAHFIEWQDDPSAQIEDMYNPLLIV